MLCYLLNSLCQLLYRREYIRFLKTAKVEAVQAEKLKEILRNNRNTRFGREHGFSRMATYEEYARGVPLSQYDDYRELLDAAAAGEPDVLTAGRVKLFEPTSGSSRAKKLIPYTNGLKLEFQRGIRPWIYDLYRNCPGVKWGRSYWSVTPVTDGGGLTPGGIPVGFEEDGEYFGKLEKRLFDLVFAVGGDVKHAPDMDTFYFRTCLGLLRCRRLTLVSVWNPTLFLLLLDYMRQNSASLLAALPGGRAKRLSPVLAAGRFDEVFPHLRLISCWGDGNAAPYAQRLKSLFPKAVLQPKGLLATECFVSFPLLGEEGARLSVYSHFFEFIDCDSGEIFLAHQLREGGLYEVAVTTSGGLYRYRMRDMVKVVAAGPGRVPAIRFAGRNDRTSDLFGEKLGEPFVREVLTRLGVGDGFAMLAPEGERYVLYVQCAQPPSPARLDALLRESYHYDYCRSLGQLKEVRVFQAKGAPERDYLQRCAAGGQRLGDIKPSALSLQGGWDAVLEGEYI